MTDPLIESLRAAVAANPGDAELRLHLAELLLTRRQVDDAIAQASAVLAAAPGDVRARDLLGRALVAGPDASDAAASAPTSSAGGPPDSSASVPPSAPGPAAPSASAPPPPSSGSATPPTSAPPSTPAASTASAPSAPPPPPSAPPASSDFDWSAAESQIADAVPPMFVSNAPGEPAFDEHDLQRSTVTLADVGGLTEVKDRLNSAFLAPLRNPELRALYGKSLRGGLLLYGPPGCGKTFLARAVAGELGAAFLSVGLSDILDRYMGGSEKNVHDLFQLARQQAPCVLFLDELDAIGQRRSQSAASGMRGVVVALLEELDGVATDNEGVFVLAATNQPWDVDPALRRPGRIDRTLLVLPPDEPARAAIFRGSLRTRPVESIDLGLLARKSDRLTGADIGYVCELASERALLDSTRTGVARMIGMPDLLDALAEVSPSATPWLESARNVVSFGQDDGTFAELRAYLKRVGRL